MTRSLFEDTNPRELKELLAQVHAREAVLPNFQRDFVWDPNATQELIVSIASNFPAGSILRIRNTRQLFDCRAFEGAPDIGERVPTYLILDGQQRLTSLYQAFYGVGDHRYFVDLKKLLNGEDFEEAIFHIRAKRRQCRKLETFEVQAAELILPLGVLKGGSGGFAAWKTKVARTRNGEERDRLEDALDTIPQKYVQTVDDYRFPVVTLADTTGADAVCTIFETLNRTGVRLSPFELLTARFWPQGISLRTLWERAQAAHPTIADFEVDPYYLLQAVTLLSRPTPSCKRGDVLDLSSESITEWWEKAAQALDHALRMLREDCGLLVPQWLPYNTLLIPLTAVLARHPTPAGPAAHEHRAKLVRWFWCSVFGQIYENAPNSQAARDVTELGNWLSGGKEPASVSSLRFDPRILRDTTPKQRALYRGVICLILSNHPRDFHSGQPLTGKLIVDSHVDDHHVFPFDYLKSDQTPVRLRDCVLNRTLIDRTTNQRIGKKAPSRYLREIGGDVCSRILPTHLLPPAESGPLWLDLFEPFLAWRQDVLWKQIMVKTGLTQSSDLLDDDEATG